MNPVRRTTRTVHKQTQGAETIKIHGLSTRVAGSGRTPDGTQSTAIGHSVCPEDAYQNAHTAPETQQRLKALSRASPVLTIKGNIEAHSCDS